MQRLEAKSIHGRTYYYLSQWGWKNGKCRRLSQKYLGKLEDLAQAVQGTGPAPEYAVVLDWGLPQALWREADRAQVVPHVPAARLARGFGGATDFPAFLGSHGAYPTRDRPGHLAATHRRRLATRADRIVTDLL